MTKKEILTAIMDGTIDHDTLVAFCEKEIASLDKKADKARERAAAKKEAGDELQSIVEGVLTSDFASRDDITALVQEQFPEATVGKVGYRLSALVKAGVAQKAETVVEGENGKRKVTVYALA